MQHQATPGAVSVPSESLRAASTLDRLHPTEVMTLAEPNLGGLVKPLLLTLQTDDAAPNVCNPPERSMVPSDLV